MVNFLRSDSRAPFLRENVSLARIFQPIARLALFVSLWSSLAAAGLRANPGEPSHFSFTGNLATPRAGHIAVLLPDGKVLVAGGNDGTTPLLTAELYDPVTGIWTATGNVSAGFVSGTATLLQNGTVLVVGAPNGVVQLYDPSTGNWSLTGSLPSTRRSFTVTLLPDGKVLITGGDEGSVSSCQLYDPASGNWNATGSLLKRRSNHTATLLPNGKVLVAGGYTLSPPPSHNILSIPDAELYDPATGNWSQTGSLKAARAEHTATLLPDGRVLVAAGEDQTSFAGAELYDPTTETWTQTGPLAVGREHHTATMLPNGLVLVAGGSGFSGSAAMAELYDPATGTWSSAGDLHRDRAFHASALLPDGKVLVAGGAMGSTTFSSTELYDANSLSAPARLRNIATRLNVLTGDKTLIGGFIVTGSAAKKVMLRAIGPSLPLPGTLVDPVLELHLTNGTIVTNDNWKIDDQTGQSQEMTIRATTIPPSNDVESAMVQTLVPGNYTAIVKGKNGGHGIAVVEAYDLDQTAPSELANISTRGFVDNGNNVMIGGFIFGPKDSGIGEVVVRAIGPSLGLQFGGSTTRILADPTLEVRDGNGELLASNDNWKINDANGFSQEMEIRGTRLDPRNDLESALALFLPPGNYTAIVAGKSGGTGIGLVEVYNLH